MRGKVQVARTGQRGTNGDKLKGDADRVAPIPNGTGDLKIDPLVGSHICEKHVIVVVCGASARLPSKSGEIPSLLVNMQSNLLVSLQQRPTAGTITA